MTESAITGNPAVAAMLTADQVIARHNISRLGTSTGRPIVAVHGFGCDQNMWRLVTPAFAVNHPVVLLDLVGCGGSDLSAYNPTRYGTLGGYAADLVEVLEALDLHDVVLVGHSVSAMVSMMTAQLCPQRVSALVMVSPSPRYIDSDDYVGGFSESDIAELLDSLDDNWLGWSAAISAVIMGNADHPELAGELNASFCRTDPAVAGHFARVTFLSDSRAELAEVRHPTLVLQCRDDVIASQVVGEFVAAQIPDSTYRLLDATGHCPHLSAPSITAAAIQEFLADVG